MIQKVLYTVQSVGGPGDFPKNSAEPPPSEEPYASNGGTVALTSHLKMRAPPPLTFRPASLL